MDELDFAGWNEADWEGVFARYHTDDVLVDVHGQAPTHGIREHIQAMKAFVESTGGAPIQVKSHPIRFGSGDWTCVVGELEDGSRTAPSIHVRAALTWLAIFPLVAIGLTAMALFPVGWDPVLRALVLTLAVVSQAVSLVVPRLMSIYDRYLAPRRQA